MGSSMIQKKTPYLPHVKENRQADANIALNKPTTNICDDTLTNDLDDILDQLL